MCQYPNREERNPRVLPVRGLVLTVIGGFVMYTERSEVLEVLRAVRTHREPGAEAHPTQQLGI